MRLGCIGIGSNAIRLLVASWKDGQLCDVRRERRGTRLFAGLIGGRLTEESIQSSVNAVEELAQCARGDGAQEIFVFATSAHISRPIPSVPRHPTTVVTPNLVIPSTVASGVRLANPPSPPPPSTCT